MHEEQDTESPGQPHGGAICAQQGTCKGAQSPGSEAAQQGGQTWLAWGWGPWGSPWAHICSEGRATVFTLGESIRKKVRVEGDYRLKRWWGQDQPLERGFFLEKLRVNTRPGDAV